MYNTNTKDSCFYCVCVCAGVWPEVQLTVLSHIDAACLRSAVIGKLARLECQNRIAVLDMSYAYTMYRCDTIHVKTNNTCTYGCVYTIHI